MYFSPLLLKNYEMVLLYLKYIGHDGRVGLAACIKGTRGNESCIDYYNA